MVETKRIMGNPIAYDNGYGRCRLCCYKSTYLAMCEAMCSCDHNNPMERYPNH